MESRDGCGKLGASTSNGRLWRVMVKNSFGVNIAATHVAPIATPATATPILGLYHPGNTGFNYKLHRTRLVSFVGAPAGGAFLWVVVPDARILIESDFSHVNCSTFATGNGDGLKTYCNTAPGLRHPGAMFGTPGGPGSGAAISGTEMSSFDDNAGGIELRPGNFIGLFAAGVGGGNWSVAPFLEYEAVPSVSG